MRARLAALFAVGAIVGAACAHPSRIASRKSASIVVSTPSPTHAANAAPASNPNPALLRRFRDCTAITADLRAQALRYVTAYGLPGSGAGPIAYSAQPTMAEADRGAPAAAAAPAPQAGVDYSPTNVQEAGVDEPDTVKTDGRRIFVVSGQTLRAIEVDGPRLAGSLALPRWGAQLLLAGDRLLVIGGGGPVVEPMMRPLGGGPASVPPYGGDQTVVQVVDVSQPAAMRVVATLHLDGGYVAARQIDGVARLVVRRGGPAVDFTYPRDGSPAAADAAIAANRRAIAAAPVTRWIPRYRLESSGGTAEGALSSCADTYRPALFSGFGTVTVVTIDPRNPTPRGGSTVVGGADIVYAAQRNLYVTSQRWPAPLAAAPESMVPLPDQTQIHAFDITGRSARYTASGVVAGTLLNQFSMSEWDGYLRVASMSGPIVEPPAPSTSQSLVTVLWQHGSTLVPVGRLAGLGAGQRLYAVRFIGALGYVVTFRQIDPLYVLDLSDPRLPRVSGELHVPGFSSYLHPVGGGLLLGVGETVDANSRPDGTKASLFDVSNPSHPRDLTDLSLGGPNFQTQFDHHAFLWWGPERLAVLPLQSYSPEGGDSFNGAVVLKVDGTLREVKRLAQPSGHQGSYPITRSLVARGQLFTVSDAGVMSSDLGSLDERAWLPFQ